jgi:hypothetical protein
MSRHDCGDAPSLRGMKRSRRKTYFSLGAFTLFAVTERVSVRHCEERSNPEGFHKVMSSTVIFARHNFVMFTVWIASYLAMTPENAPLLREAKQSRLTS